ncbi:hypothetical protein [Acidithiobacillus thiooxidans]|uniref:hypothetical protein n=1 Tax=Acidithiobacillus thiooxidans TaxID=930 RepID=UPI001C06B6D8|nr:hypothetical protein [Acidithiobacillus thiooxidans]MBU2843694.1 hypothetical protein [Acidithiobacillus thiooxidans]
MSGAGHPAALGEGPPRSGDGEGGPKAPAKHRRQGPKFAPGRTQEGQDKYALLTHKITAKGCGLARYAQGTWGLSPPPRPLPSVQVPLSVAK